MVGRGDLPKSAFFDNLEHSGWGRAIKAHRWLNNRKLRRTKGRLTLVDCFPARTEEDGVCGTHSGGGNIIVKNLINLSPDRPMFNNGFFVRLG